MSQIVDEILADVSLDGRVRDGVFRMDENDHMDALRDNLVKKGLTLEDAVIITNKMIEGKYPQRQAYRASDGLIITWPTPAYKAKAMRENPGKYVDQDPRPQKPTKPAPVEPTPQKVPPIPVPTEPEPTSVKQGDKILAIEPPRGPEKPESSPMPPESPVTLPKTPEQVAAHKEIVRQMIQGDDASLMSKFHPSISESCIKQLTMLQEYALAKGLKKASEFLSKCIKF